MRLVRELIKIQHQRNARIFGFVLCSDIAAQRRYDRIAKKVRRIDKLYFEKDSHWIYELNNSPH